MDWGGIGVIGDLVFNGGLGRYGDGSGLGCNDCGGLGWYFGRSGV